jgi:hypothetical protein
MGRLRHLSYANVMASIAVFIALGGAGYAAVKLPKSSVGARQLKKGAVTPAKLSKASKNTLRGRTGPRGPAGPKGDSGAAGQPGPQGPGAVSFEYEVPTANTFQGIQVGTTCKPNELRIELKTVGETMTLKAGGTYTVWSSPETGDVTAPASGLNNGIAVYAVALEEEVVMDVIARNTAFGASWGQFNLTLDDGCRFRGVYTPSTAG